MKMPNVIFQFACIRRGSAQSEIDLEWEVTRYFSFMLVKMRRI